MKPLTTWLPAFAILFVAYQAPEGIGGRWLQSMPVAATLMLACLGVAVGVARGLGRSAADAYALAWQRETWAVVALGVGLAFAAKALALAVGLHWGVYERAPAPEPAMSAAGWAGTLAWLALATWVPSLAEDIVTRGFWLRLVGARWTGWTFVLFTATVYVLNHIYRLANGPSEWAMLFCYGLAYGAACWTRGSLWAAVGLHWGWNLAGESLALAWPTRAVDVELGRALSGAAHLVLLALVLAGARLRGPGHPATEP